MDGETEGLEELDVAQPRDASTVTLPSTSAEICSTMYSSGEAGCDPDLGDQPPERLRLDRVVAVVAADEERLLLAGARPGNRAGGGRAAAG